ncbi:hypothetical protein [Desulfonatronum sp. SC1]|uniref:nucleotidyltransferase domain-containing protein n=1 Tax=Desulfonatronum sp. SC1 TaxID=2109626 RepID=UPI0018EE79F9|nr:hypothetical protein [Desulfonatronum sp. SC1]
MKISFEEENDAVVFRVSEFHKKYESVLKICFYSQESSSYTKRFPKNTKYLDKIMKYYYDHAQDMFDQLGYFKPIPWDIALFDFAKELENKDINWWLTGSCAVCVRGIPLNPHDVDIMIDSSDVYKISDMFSDYLIEPIVDTNGWLTKDFGVIFRHARIDIASDPQDILDNPEPIDCGPSALANLEEVNWKGLIIKVPPLHLSLNVNKRRKRIDRVTKIEQYLNQIS